MRKFLRQIYRFIHPGFQNLFLEYKVDFKPRYGHGNPPHQVLYEIINRNRDEYAGLLRKAIEYKDYFWAIRPRSKNKSDQDPVWDNGFFPGLDIIGLYLILSVYKPRKYIEIGSGNSTRVAFKAKKEQSLETLIVSIDPKPRAEIDRLADRVIRKRFEELNDNLYEELDENDILFIDNSHRILPNSDSTVFFMEVLPLLKKGVIVQVHDIYLPYDYPDFMCERFYSEQYGLAMFILANPSRYQVLLPNYFISEDKELSSVLSSLWNHSNLSGAERHGGSFWIRIAE